MILVVRPPPLDRCPRSGVCYLLEDWWPRSPARNAHAAPHGGNGGSLLRGHDAQVIEARTLHCACRCRTALVDDIAGNGAHGPADDAAEGPPTNVPKAAPAYCRTTVAMVSSLRESGRQRRGGAATTVTRNLAHGSAVLGVDHGRFGHADGGMFRRQMWSPAEQQNVSGARTGQWHGQHMAAPLPQPALRLGPASAQSGA